MTDKLVHGDSYTFRWLDLSDGSLALKYVSTIYSPCYAEALTRYLIRQYPNAQTGEQHYSRCRKSGLGVL